MSSQNLTKTLNTIEDIESRIQYTQEKETSEEQGMSYRVSKVVMVIFSSID